MLRFMKNGVVHQALGSTTEWLNVGPNEVELCTFIVSHPEEAAGINGHFGVEWTPSDFIEWLPSSALVLHSEWIYGQEEKDKKCT